MMKTYVKWTAEDLTYLRESYVAGTDIDAISKRLGRDPRVVKSKLYDLRITRSGRPYDKSLQTPQPQRARPVQPGARTIPLLPSEGGDPHAWL